MSNRKKRTTLSDVAGQAGVSRTAAAKVLLGTGGEHVRVSKATRLKVEESAVRLSYSPNRAAQQLRGAGSHILGVLMHTMNAPVMLDRLAAIEKEAAAHGYRLLVAQTHHDAGALAHYVGDMQGYGVDGMLCLFDVTPESRRDTAHLFKDVKHVIFHGSPLFADACCVRVDTVAAVRQTIRHLLGRGRRRIGMELWNMDDKLMQLREQGYRETMAEAHIDFDEHLIWTAQADNPNPSDETVEQATRVLVDERNADAIVASNDLWAVRLIQKIKARGRRVPEDVAVTGYDNLNVATVIEPSLTTIDQCHDLYARAMVELMLDIISGQPIPADARIRVVQPRLVVRHSS